jgi:7,8-dihydropterin-6-yl-methyl-4-(beta-D-ribofuranosyl)aminobenzene 5'-phosphate synthase
MKLTILTENSTGTCPGEHGLSILIEDDKKVLFDVGATDIFKKNAKLLNINLDEVNHVALSHGHWDHVNGLQFLKNKKLICHPDCFMKKFTRRTNKPNRMPFNLEKAKEQFEVILTKEPYKISENITFLGEIPRKNDFEAKTTTFYTENNQDDFILDDSALAIKTNKGLVVIAGCSHAGICNIIEYAKKITGLNIYAIIGGFHLLKDDEISKKTIEYLKKENIEHIYPGHCVKEPVIELFEKELNAKRLHSGDVIEL